MTKDNDNNKEEVSMKDVLVSLAYTQEAIINTLEKKGIATRKEIIDEIVNTKQNNKHQ